LEDRETPAVFNVGPGDVATLIADINTANINGQSNTINLSAGTYDLTAVNNNRYGPNAFPAISSNLTINGNGAVLQRDSSLAPNMRLFGRLRRQLEVIFGPGWWRWDFSGLGGLPLMVSLSTPQGPLMFPLSS
jgi:hypothetical protein